MDLEYFWAIVAWAVVIGGGLLGALVFYYWFAVVPDRVLDERRARSRAVPPAPNTAREVTTSATSDPIAY